MYLTIFAVVGWGLFLALYVPLTIAARRATRRIGGPGVGGRILRAVFTLAGAPVMVAAMLRADPQAMAEGLRDGLQGRGPKP